MEPNTKNVIQFAIEAPSKGFTYTGFIQEVPASLLDFTLDARRKAGGNPKEQRHENVGENRTLDEDTQMRTSTSSPEPDGSGSPDPGYPLGESDSLSSSSSMGSGSFKRRSTGRRYSPYPAGDPLSGRGEIFQANSLQVIPNTTETYQNPYGILGPPSQPDGHEEVGSGVGQQAPPNVSGTTKKNVTIKLLPPRPRVTSQDARQPTRPSVSDSKKRDITVTFTPLSREIPIVTSQDARRPTRPSVSDSKKRDITVTLTPLSRDIPMVTSQDVRRPTRPSVSDSKKRDITVRLTPLSREIPGVTSQDDLCLQAGPSVSTIVAPPPPIFKEIKISPAFMPVSENPTVKEIHAAHGMLKLNSPNTDFVRNTKDVQAAFSMLDLRRWKPYQHTAEAQLPEKVQQQFLFQSVPENPNFILGKGALIKTADFPSMPAPLMSPSLSLMAENSVTVRTCKPTPTSGRLVLKTGKLQEGPESSSTLERQGGNTIETSPMEIGLAHSATSPTTKSKPNAKRAHVSNLQDNLLPRAVNSNSEISEQETVSSMYTLLKRNKKVFGYPNEQACSTSADSPIHLRITPLTNQENLAKRCFNIPSVQLSLEDIKRMNERQVTESVDYRESNTTITIETLQQHSLANPIPPAFADENLSPMISGSRVPQKPFQEQGSSVPMSGNVLIELESASSASGQEMKSSDGKMPVPKNKSYAYLNEQGFLITTRKLKTIPNEAFMNIARNVQNPPSKLRKSPPIRVNEANADTSEPSDLLNEAQANNGCAQIRTPSSMVFISENGREQIRTPSSMVFISENGREQIRTPSSMVFISENGREQIRTPSSMVFISESEDGVRRYEYRPFMSPPKQPRMLESPSEKVELVSENLQVNSMNLDSENLKLGSENSDSENVELGLGNLEVGPDNMEVGGENLEVGSEKPIAIPKALPICPTSGNYSQPPKKPRIETPVSTPKPQPKHSKRGDCIQPPKKQRVTKPLSKKTVSTPKPQPKHSKMGDCIKPPKKPTVKKPLSKKTVSIPKPQPKRSRRGDCIQPPKKPRVMKPQSAEPVFNPNPKPIRPTCGDCSRQYYCTSHLYRHIMQKHPNFEKEVPNRCTIPDIECNHYGGAASSCDICIKRIKDQLEIEYRTPSYALEYVCQWCTQAYKSLLNLQKHLERAIDRGGCRKRKKSKAQPSKAPSTLDA